MIREFKRYILKNWFWISAGLVITKIAMDYSYGIRGDMSFGGEWLILPFILFAKEAIPEMIEEILDVFREEDDEESDDENVGTRR